MISRELHEAIQKIEKLRESLKNIHLLELLPQLMNDQKKLIDYIEKIDKFKDKIEKK